MPRPPRSSDTSLVQAGSALKTGDEQTLGQGVRAHTSEATSQPDEQASLAARGAEEGTSVLTEGDLNFTHESTTHGSRYAALDPRALWLGRAFGSFRIVRELASGGMASVFLARKDGPGRVSQHAAIKVVHPHLACQSGFVDMFLDEARIVSSVHHPNVCRVLDFGTESGTYYLAMEYVLGETWAALQVALAADDAGRAVLPALSAYVIAQAADGLHAAHEATDDEGKPLHIVHRDVSPQNIFVAYDGSVRVLDFGIARAADRITTTQAGTVKGRLAYMAPEQMEGKPLDPRADIWSLGVVLREALEGRRLFRRPSDAETMLAVTTEALPDWQGNVAPKLKEIVERCLERDLSVRYRRAHLLSADLARFSRGQAIPMAMPELSAWMHRLFPQALEEKRRMLQEAAPEPAGGAATAPHTPWAPWTAALSSNSLTPSADSRSRGNAYAPEPDVLADLFPAQLAHEKSLRLARVLFALVVLFGAAIGVYFARKPASETQLVATALPASRAVLAPQAVVPATLHLSENDQAAPKEEGGSSSDGKPTRRRKRERSAAEDGEGTQDQVLGAAASEDAPTGTVVVAFHGGWAEVFWGEKLLGTTPGRFSLPVGKHTLSIKSFGTGKAETRVIEVVAGGTAKLVYAPSEP